MSTASEYFDFFAERLGARAPEEIRAQADKVLSKALKEAVWGSAASESRQRFLPMAAVETKGAYSSHKSALKENELKQFLAAFLLARGALTKERFWLATKAGIFVGFPVLMIEGNRGAAQWALAGQMKKILASGKKSNIGSYLAAVGVVPKEEYEDLLFAKGYCLMKSPSEAKALKEDIGRIIDAMTADKGQNPPRATGMKLKVIAEM